MTRGTEPAFATPDTHSSYGQQGLSTRDYMATHVDIPSILLWFESRQDEAKWLGLPEPTTIEERIAFVAALHAKLRYTMADAMLEERLK